MGVPGLFANLKNKYKHIIKKINYDENELEDIDLFKNLIPNDFDIIFFDFNCIIHPIVHLLYKTYSHLNKLDFEKKIMVETMNYVKKILEHVKIKNISAIFIDGVCPYAKMVQQRQRRFASVLDKEIINNIRKNEGYPLEEYYDTNSITPGTEFMENFHQYLLNYISKWNADDTNPKMIYSSFHEYGEGEHKIINYIKNHSDELTHKNILIYGLDADLIILSLTLANKFNIKLLREKDGVSLTELDMIIFDINECAKSIMIELSNDEHMDNYGFVNDFIFITTLLGNDFLPSNPTLNMKFHNRSIKAVEGYNLLISTYKELYSTYNEYIVNWNDKKLEINWKFFRELIDKLANFEQQYFESTRNKYSNYQNKSGIDLKIDMLNSLVLFKINDPLKMYAKYINYNERKKRFINHYFGNKTCECIDSNGNKYGSQLYNKNSDINEKYYDNKSFSINQHNYDEVIKEYLKTIGFIMYYYYHGCPNNLYYYKYCNGILLSDLYEYLNRKISSNTNLDDIFMSFHNKKNKKILPIQQLLIVLPKKSFYLLPNNVNKMFDGSNNNILVKYFMNKYFPSDNDIKRDYLNKTKLYQASLIIKIPKLLIINAILSDIKVTKNEILRFI